MASGSAECRGHVAAQQHGGDAAVAPADPVASVERHEEPEGLEAPDEAEVDEGGEVVAAPERSADGGPEGGDPEALAVRDDATAQPKDCLLYTSPSPRD